MASDVTRGDWDAVAALHLSGGSDPHASSVSTA